MTGGGGGILRDIFHAYTIGHIYPKSHQEIDNEWVFVDGQVPDQTELVDRYDVVSEQISHQLDRFLE